MNHPKTELNNIAPALSIWQTCWVVLCLFLWAVGFIWLMALWPVNSLITPAVWFYTSTTLFLVFVISRYKADVQTTLGLCLPKLQWLLFAAFLGLVYWWVDQWLAVYVLKIDTQLSITDWRQANKNFIPATVFISSVFLAPVLEELFFRGLIFKNLSNHVNGWLAASVSASLFAAIHWSWPEFISLFVVGLLYAWLTARSKSIFPAITAHLIHNSLTFWVYAQSTIS